MLPFGHAAGGYLVGTLFSVVTKSKAEEIRKLQSLGVIGGLLPDLDLWIYQVLHKLRLLRVDSPHHTWLTHTFPFYLLPGSLMVIWSNYTKRTDLAKYTMVVTISACVHLVQDMIGSGDGIQLLFPISRRMFGIYLLGVHGQKWRTRYVRNPIFIVEIIIILVALLISGKQKLK